MLTASARPLDGRHPFRLGAAMLLGTGMFYYLLIVAEQGRLALALAITVLFVSMAHVSVRAAILGVMAYVTFVGDLRRMLIPFFPWSGMDPLLLVGAIFSIVVFAGALASKQVQFDTPLAKCMLGLLVVMVLQIFNPEQGGLLVGVGGVLFVIVPLLWFWVGRTYATEPLMRMLFYRVVVPLALVGAAMGIYQSLYGYLPYQKLWLQDNWYAGLGDAANPAPISLFASNTEYANYTVVGAALLWAAFVMRRRPAILLIPPLLTAVMLTGTRGPVAKLILAIAVLWAVRGQNMASWVVRGGFALVVGLAGIGWSITTASSSLQLDENVQLRLDRQAQEFGRGEGAAGEDEGYSSSANHLSMMLNSYGWAVTHPLGYGLGSASQAAGKFGGNSHTSETDLGDSFITTGIPGGVLYHVMVVVIFVCAVRYWTRTRSLVALGLLGVLATTFLQWQGGGQYAVSTLVWFCIGALDRLYTDARRAQAVPAGPVPATAAVRPPRRSLPPRPAQPTPAY